MSLDFVTVVRPPRGPSVGTSVSLVPMGSTVHHCPKSELTPVSTDPSIADPC
jgi:hypothetical protein